ncbi:hypothetical protein [Novosphingobium sp.]|uniref:hypothetical protein n=1 Tax=Novosphingobium sp. TaxID=1874826 RepID=UPI001D5D8C4A|nr:hypothetical protein [Novosphingobium sp.]MBX9662120.1 hypothetical protein [Novosphingobium sp.]
MDRKSRVRVRPIANAGVTDKKFKRFGRQAPIPLHELTVLMDLEKGVLSSLDRYLAKHKGIPDRRVALALRKLISGSVHRAQYRLVAIRHPGLPSDCGGAPKRQRHSTAERHRLIVQRLEELIAQGDKKGIAKETIMSEFNVTKRTVERALRAVDKRRQSPAFHAEVEQNVATGMTLRAAIHDAGGSRREN